MNISNLNFLLHRSTFAAALLVLLLGMAEFYQRAMLGQDVSQSHNKTPVSQASAVALLPNFDGQVKQALTELYQKYDKQQRELLEREQNYQTQTQANAEPGVTLSEADIAAQNGELLSLATEQGKLYLRGVVRTNAANGHKVSNTDNYALVQKVEHQDKNAISIVKLAQGDALDGFTVTQLNLNSITLERGTQKIELLMYKTNKQEE